MENVVAFNNELTGLYSASPPISKAKMAAITRGAMKAIKFYKHVVQSVEKFILKCKPEYKIPGLYVIDSIVRQSRHQYGPEKDVFAPRFARNIKQTFANLFRCASEDKSKIIRVLNLWQKNSVFAPEVIQPLFDLADPNHPIYHQLPQNTSVQDSNLSGTNGLNSSIQESGTPVLNVQDEGHGIPELNSNNLSQLLKDPNVLRQLQTLQQFKKQQEEQQNKLNEMRLQEEAFEKHLQNVLKAQSVGSNLMGLTGANTTDHIDDEVKFLGAETVNSKVVEVINLDAGDSRSPTPAEHDRYKRRRSRSRSRSRARGTGRTGRSGRSSRSRSPHSHSRSLSPKTSRRRSSRERERISTKEKERDKERDREYERERRKKGIPEAKPEHLSVCTTTLWVGHLSKLVHQEELSDTFGKFGDIVSIDMIYPRGCAFIVMNRRQDAHKAMTNLKNHKLQGRVITISWAAGKGVKSKEWKDFWDLDLGVTFIPWSKLNKETDLDTLEEGGMFDEETMPGWMKDKINHAKNNKDKVISATTSVTSTGGLYGSVPEGLPKIDTSQPPPTLLQSGPPPTLLAPPPAVPMVPPFQMGPPPRLMGPMGVPLPGIPPGMPPNMMAGMPPMMLPGGMIPPPGFGAIPPTLDKSGAGNATLQAPPPGFLSNIHMLGLPPQFPQQLEQPPPITTQTQPQNNKQNSPADDQMDIEMEDDLPNNTSSGISKSNDTISQIPDFNKPPPLFSDLSNLSNAPPGEELDENIAEELRNDEEFGRRNIENIFDKRRNDFGGNRSGERSRWERDGNGTNRSENRRGRNEQGSSVWSENEAPFGEAFSADSNDKKQTNPFFDRRGGGEFGGERRNDVGFFSNNMSGNRFGGRGTVTMRGGPQFGPRIGNAFNQRQNTRGGQGALSGQDGLFSNYMERTFEREERGGNRGSNRGSNRRAGFDGAFDSLHRGGGFGAQQRGNWWDEENANGSRSRDGSNNRLFERRNERERDRERDRDRDRDRNRERDRDRDRDRDFENRDRRGGGGNDTRNSRNSREQRISFDRNRDRSVENNERDDYNNLNSRRNSENKSENENTVNNLNEKSEKQIQDTEEDWDNELEDFDEIQRKSLVSDIEDLRPPGEEDNSVREEQEEMEFTAPTNKTRKLSFSQHQSNIANTKSDIGNEIFNNTPLYDEPADSVTNNCLETRNVTISDDIQNENNHNFYEKHFEPEDHQEIIDTQSPTDLNIKEYEQQDELHESTKKHEEKIHDEINEEIELTNESMEKGNTENA